MSLNARMAIVSGLSSLLVGCFAPNAAVESQSSTGGSGSMGETDAGTTQGPSGATEAGTDATGDASTTGNGASESGTPETESVSDTVSTGPGPGCGNGELDEGEECDDGPDNGSGDCTENCTIAFCGDSIVSGEEMCDEGDENGTELGDCAPDCSKLVEARTITMSYSYSTNGDMGGAGAVDHVDARCENAGLEGFKAIFADGTNRRASVTPFAGDGQIDWVLTPWTRYVRDDGELVWVTDEVALLGVRDGAAQPLLAPIASELAPRAATGLRANWVTELNADCNNWTSNSTGASQYQGEPEETALDRVLAGVTPEISPGNCATSALVYCVEQ